MKSANWTVGTQIQERALNSAQPSARSRSSERVRGWPGPGNRSHGQREGADRVACRVDRDHRGRAGRRDQDPGEGWPGHLGGGLGHREQRVDVAKPVTWRELDGEAGQRGLEERVAGTDDERGGDEQPQPRVPHVQRDGEDALRRAPGHVGA